MKNKKIALELYLAVLVVSQGQSEELSLGKIDGNVRLGYQYGKIADASWDEASVGGYLHYDSTSWKGLSVGAGLHTTQGNGTADDVDLGYNERFFDADNDNYTLLSELYLRGVFGNTEAVVGRQELDTPFADSNDVGMVPNRFEAASVTNKDIADTTITLGYIRSIAGGGAEDPKDFIKLNGNDGIYMSGVNYDGIKNLALQGWYYYGDNLTKIGFVEVIYSGELGSLGYEAGVQYANQRYNESSNDVYGAMIAMEESKTGLGAMVGYNETNGISADNLFGGGPFFTNLEHGTIADAGDDGKAFKIGGRFDAKTIGLDGLVLSVEHLWLDKKDGLDGKNMGYIAEYSYSDDITLRAYYNDIREEQRIKNLRVFADYSF